MRGVLTDLSTGFRYVRVSGYDAKKPEEEPKPAEKELEDEDGETDEIADDLEDDEGDK